MMNEVANRHLCSNLVSIQLPASAGRNREVVGNLEEISPSGAYLNVEQPVATGLAVRMFCTDSQGAHEFKGAVLGCSHDPVTGYYIELRFRPGSEWSPEIFQPTHMLRADTVLGLSKDVPAPKPACCDRGVCPKEVLSQILEPESTLTGRVRAVAQEVAALCGGMTEKESVQCFGTLFGAGPDCRLYGEFKQSYAQERQSRGHKHARTLRAQYKGLMRLAGAIDPEIVRSPACADAVQGPVLVAPPAGSKAATTPRRKVASGGR